MEKDNILTFLVTVDANDGDYVTNVIKVSEEAYLKFLPLIKAIDDFVPYLTKIGVEYHNFPYGECCRKDLYEKTIYEIYNQFESEYIDEFIENFIHGDYEYGFHTIESITPITLGESVVDGSYEKRKNRADSDVAIQEYNKKNKEYYSYHRESDGKAIHSIPFKEMNDYEKQLCNEHSNLWLKYRPDITDPKAKFDVDKYLRGECN